MKEMSRILLTTGIVALVCTSASAYILFNNLEVQAGMKDKEWWALGFWAGTLGLGLTGIALLATACILAVISKPKSRPISS